jgi:CRISPR-associated protein Csb1
MDQTDAQRFDDLLNDDGPAALVFHRRLLPVEGNDAWIFPPTFAQSESADEAEEGSGGDYQIDPCGDPKSGNNVCLIDSVGSQANRMEPLFKLEPYCALVPKRVVTMANGDEVNLLDAGHRAADAAIRFSTELGPRAWEAFLLIKTKRDYSKLLALAPTSLVFGVWDSRGTGVKVQRLVKSTIRAYNVTEAKRSATYRAAYDYVDNGLIDPTFDKGTGKNNSLSQEGFKYSLATATHGGVRVAGEIRQDAMLNLVSLRTITADMDSRRYLLGLALVALSFRDQSSFNLREGCLLRAAKKEDLDGHWKCVNFDSTERVLSLTHEQARGYANLAVAKMTFETTGQSQFDGETAAAWLKLEKKKRKTLAKQQHPAKAIAEENQSATNPKDQIRKMVEALKLNRSGTKLIDAPARKLKDCLQNIQDSDDLKPLANDMLAALDDDDDPASKIQKLNDLLRRGAIVSAGSESSEIGSEAEGDAE